MMVSDLLLARHSCPLILDLLGGTVFGTGARTAHRRIHQPKHELALDILRRDHLVGCYARSHPHPGSGDIRPTAS